MLLMKKAIGHPDGKKMFLRNIGKEIVAVGYESVGIVALISFFMGGVMAMQFAINMEHPILPQYLVGLGDCIDSGGKSRFEHCLGNRYDANYTTN